MTDSERFGGMHDAYSKFPTASFPMRKFYHIYTKNWWALSQFFDCVCVLLPFDGE